MGSRKQQQKPCMEHLPNDVLINNIFIRLPAKQLAQMRSLSKLWNVFLSQPSFIKSHLHHSIRNNNEVLIVFDDGFPYSQPFTTYSSRSPNIQLTNLIKPPSINDLHLRYVIGSVNGLICFFNNAIHVWNPSLSALLALPPYTIRIERDYNILALFGFDPKSDDYKVVVVTFYVDFVIQKESLQVEVYSMRKGCWETISERSKFPSHVTMIYTNDEVFVAYGQDGRFHWIGDVDQRQTIVAFDLSVETFSEISLPDSIQDSAWNVLGVLSQKLCVMSRKDDDCEVWEMDKYGEAKSWVKNHVFSHMINGDDFDPIGFTLNNDFLFGVGRRLALFDPIEAVVKLFKTKKRSCLTTTKVVEFVDSLVWVVPSNGRTISSL